MRPCRSEGALRRAVAAPAAPVAPRQILEPVGARAGRVAGREEGRGPVPGVADSALEQMQRQLQRAQVMLSSCVQSVEAAWDLSAQRLTEFDQKLSALDVRLVELSQKQQEEYELPEAHIQSQQTAQMQSQMQLSLLSLESRLEEVVKRLDSPILPEPQPVPLESLDFLNHRVASLSERLAAEARVREAQFRRLESLFSSQCTTGTTCGTTMESQKSGIDGTSTTARSSFLEVVTDGEAERRYRDGAKATWLQL